MRYILLTTGLTRKELKSLIGNLVEFNGLYLSVRLPAHSSIELLDMETRETYQGVKVIEYLIKNKKTREDIFQHMN